jgi:hypothetical protein
MAVTSAQIVDFLLKNPDMTDDQIVKAMETYGVSPAQMAQAVGLDEGAVAARAAAVIPQGSAKLLGDTWVQPNYQVTGSGEDQQVGNLESISVYKASGGINDPAAVGTQIQNYTPTGEFTGTSQVAPNRDLSFFGGLLNAFKDPVVLAALAGGYGAGLFGGAGALGGATALTAAEAAGLGLTAAEAASLGLSATEFAAATAGTGALAGGLSTGGTVAGMGTGTGITTAGAGGLGGGTTVAGLGTGVGTGITTTGAGLGATGTGAGITAGTGLTGAGVLAGSGLGTTLLGTGAGALTGTGILTGSGLGTTLLGTGAGTGVTGGLTTGVGAGTLGTGALTTLPTTTLPTTTLPTTTLPATIPTSGLTAAQIGALLSGGLTTGAGLLQQQTSREAAQRAQQMIDAETAAAKQAAAFRPVGMTTRFGTSQFQVNPVTGQLTSAGYTLSPEAKNAQDRLVALAEQGLQQAEGAQAQFAPLQTGAQRLFGLGNQYLAQTPQDVAPSPELQALYNARAQQEAQLAANAQQYGQQNVLFGAGLLGQGSQAMGQYYGGQQAAYAPYTTALGQVQGLEQLAQQPLQLGANLGQTAAQAGFNVGQLGLRGSGASVELATGKAATNNPYASAISGLAANPAFGQYVGGLFGSKPATSGFSYGQYGTGVDPSTGEYFGSLYF